LTGLFLCYNVDMDLAEKLAYIKNWLGTGSINIFGLPMSGKDSVGIRFAEAIDARFLSSGLIIRALESASGNNITATGLLVPQNLFYEVVLPYFDREEIAGYPLILSSVGRWSGEENEVIKKAIASGHEIKLAVLLQVSEEDVHERWESNILMHDRGDRADDMDEKVFYRRIEEFQKKTMPVVEHYSKLGILTEVVADRTRDEVFINFVDKVYDFAVSHP